jgi:hypothetical protein
VQEQINSNSPWLDPRFLLPAISALVFLILWFGRLEYLAKATATRQKEYEGEMDEQIKQSREEHKELKAAFYNHKGDAKVHHNEAAFQEFREGLNRQMANMDRRFGSMETTLQDISRKLDGGGIHTTRG